FIFFFQAEDGIRDRNVTGVQTCALPISNHHPPIIIIIKANNIPIKPPAVGFVPKNSVGIIFWISGDPGAIIVKDIDPKTSAAGIKRWGKSAARNNDTAIGYTAKPTTNKLTPP